ncbi:hypothetical protein GCM10011342_25360 [Aquisalinus flavus]|uniref:Uncharacterized protein n=1 Tax=Aquisalinus flavus TaxID=1526572 RepID=A0A8J2V2W7_9PROT|nr:hypothetical protein GCM10011342_25360 [Aquisalinus flavus]
MQRVPSAAITVIIFQRQRPESAVAACIGITDIPIGKHGKYAQHHEKGDGIHGTVVPLSLINDTRIAWLS